MTEPAYGDGPSSLQPAADAGPVKTAVNLMFMRAALSVLSTIVLVTQKDALRDQLRASLSKTNQNLDTAVTAAITITVISTIVFTVLYVLLALQVRKGKSWARIVTLVLAGLGILTGLIGLGSPRPGLIKAFGVIDLLLDIAIVVLLVLPASRAYFRSRQAV